MSTAELTVLSGQCLQNPKSIRIGYLSLLSIRNDAESISVFFHPHSPSESSNTIVAPSTVNWCSRLHLSLQKNRIQKKNPQFLLPGWLGMLVGCCLLYWSGGVSWFRSMSGHKNKTKSVVRKKYERRKPMRLPKGGTVAGVLRRPWRSRKRFKGNMGGSGQAIFKGVLYRRPLFWVAKPINVRDVRVAKWSCFTTRYATFSSERYAPYG